MLILCMFYIKFRYIYLKAKEMILPKYFDSTLYTLASVLAALTGFAHILERGQQTINNMVHPFLPSPLPNCAETLSLYDKILTMNEVVNECNEFEAFQQPESSRPNIISRSRTLGHGNAKKSSSLPIISKILQNRMQASATPQYGLSQNLNEVLYMYYPRKFTDKLEWITGQHCHDLTFPYVYIFYIYI